MNNLELSYILYEIADILEMQGIRWKPVAYRKAARTIDSLSQGIEEIYGKGGLKALMNIFSIGENIAKKIEQYILTGKIKEYECLKKQIPKGLEEVLHVRGVGPKKAYALFKILNIDNVKKLEKAVTEGKIRSLPGFGEKSEQDILKGVEILKRGQERMLLYNALNIAREIKEKLTALKEVKNVVVAGSVRRMKETVKDIDILVISSNTKKVMDVFTSLAGVDNILAKGDTKSAVILKNGINSDVRVLEEKSFGAGLCYFTGSKDHNVELRRIAMNKGFKLSEYGLFNAKSNKYICGRTEQEIYKALGLSYVEPELRENLGEIDASRKGDLPKIIPYDSLKGDLHAHTVWSDGIDSTENMIKSCIARNYEYVAITDHSKSRHIANGLDEKRLAKHLDEINQLQKKYSQIKIFRGAEVDILSDGTLDYSNAILKKLDIVVASIHSGFKSAKDEMTKRIMTALGNEYVSIFAHPTGRLINERDPYEMNLDKIFQSAKDNNVALEINSFPSRLDLKDINIKLALNYGAKFVISTDSHSADHLKFIELGIAQARRGWLEAKDVLNTFPLRKFEKVINK